MAALTVDNASPITYKVIEQQEDYKVDNNVIIFNHSAVGIILATGLVGPFVAGSTYPVFVGWALGTVDNRDATAPTGTSSKGGKRCIVASKGRMLATGFTVADSNINDLTYVLTDNPDDVTLSSAGSADIIGNVVSIDASGTAVVTFLGLLAS